MFLKRLEMQYDPRDHLWKFNQRSIHCFTWTTNLNPHLASDKELKGKQTMGIKPQKGSKTLKKMHFLKCFLKNKNKNMKLSLKKGSKSHSNGSVMDQSVFIEEIIHKLKIFYMINVGKKFYSSSFLNSNDNERKFFHFKNVFFMVKFCGILLLILNSY